MIAITASRKPLQSTRPKLKESKMLARHPHGLSVGASGGRVCPRGNLFGHWEEVIGRGGDGFVRVGGEVQIAAFRLNCSPYFFGLLYAYCCID